MDIILLAACTKKNIAIFTGWGAFIQAWITATIPPFLLLINQWEFVG
ncbi:hypothetical protein [Aeribacillus composti]|nr:hypothetical protein [Aeribacillus composti]